MRTHQYALFFFLSMALLAIPYGCLSSLPESVAGNYSNIRDDNAALVEDGTYESFHIELSECGFNDATLWVNYPDGMDEARRQGIYRLYWDRGLAMLPAYPAGKNTGKAIYFLKNGSSFLTSTTFHDGEACCERHSDRGCVEVDLEGCRILMNETFTNPP